ncbi:MAG: 30S ribosomal protein S6 [bacterium]|nr:30S ribosomal protein S6 [bacterium]
MKRKYELMFALDAVLDDNQVEEVANKIRSAIEGREGEILEWDRWGKRRFAYEIKGRTHGVYYVTVFKILPSKISELELFLKLNEAVLRYLILVITPRMEKLIAKQNNIRSKLSTELSESAVKLTAAEVDLYGTERPLTIEEANQEFESINPDESKE